MARIPSLSRTLSSTIPFARGVADRAVSTAAPLVSGVVGRVSSRRTRRSRPEPSAPETFTPKLVVVEPEADPQASGPTPASVARNLAGPRPTAKAPAKPRPRSVPGAKLPVTRPST